MRQLVRQRAISYILATLVETYEERRWPLRSRRRFVPVDVLHYGVRGLGSRPLTNEFK